MDQPHSSPVSIVAFGSGVQKNRNPFLGSWSVRMCSLRPRTLVKYSAEISTVDSPTLCAASGIGKDRRSSTRMLVLGRAWRSCNAKVSPARPPPSTTASYRAARLLVAGTGMDADWDGMESSWSLGWSCNGAIDLGSSRRRHCNPCRLEAQHAVVDRIVEQHLGVLLVVHQHLPRQLRSLTGHVVPGALHVTGLQLTEHD